MPTFIGPLAHEIHSTAPVSTAKATKWLSAFTSRSTTHPHMHPDAQLLQRIAFGTHGNRGGITLAQMRKITAGLGGERLTPEREVEEKKPLSKDRNFERKRKAPDAVEAQGEGQEQAEDGTRDSEWEDAGAWAARQGIKEGAAQEDERSNYVGQVKGNQEPGVEDLDARNDAEMGEAQDELDAGVDKEERKRLKKERKQADKAEREAKRRRKDADED